MAVLSRTKALGTDVTVENIHPATAVETVGLAAAGEVFSGATGLVGTEDVAGFVGEAAARSEVDQEVAAEILEVGIRRFAVGMPVRPIQ